MLRNKKPSRRVVAVLFPIFLIAAFLAFQSSSAQTISCPQNLITNGDFSKDMSGWNIAFATPQLVNTGGCNGNSGFVAMWGNQVVGEGIRQTVNIQAGRTYKLSACVRWPNNNPTLPQYVRFKVRASNGPIAYTATAPTAPTIGIIGDPTNTPSIPAPGITSTAWTNITTATWIAPANFNTITINPENNNAINNGNAVSWGHITNLCLQEVSPPNFTPDTACQNQPTTFTANAPGATSWNWNFGDGSTSNLPNPVHTYTTAPATFNVTLCTNVTNCITKAVFVKAAPPPPVITGPTNAFGGQFATYSVPLAGGVIYSWTVSNGTIVGPASGAGVNNVTVQWGASGVGSIGVTVTNKGGCSSTARLRVGSDLFQCESCNAFQGQADLKDFKHAGNGNYNFSVVFSGLPSVIRVTANVISASITGSTCGMSGPVNGNVTNAANVGGFIASLPLPNGHEAIWHGPSANANGTPFNMQIKFPLPPNHCKDTLSFCVKYTFTTKDCKSCEIIRCYGPFKRTGTKSPESVTDEIKNTLLTP